MPKKERERDWHRSLLRKKNTIACASTTERKKIDEEGEKNRPSTSTHVSKKKERAMRRRWGRKKVHSSLVREMEKATSRLFRSERGGEKEGGGNNKGLPARRGGR